MTEIPPTLAAVARPGDTIFIGLGYVMSDEELTDFLANFEQFTETTGIHIAVAEGVTSMVVARPEDEGLEKEFPPEVPFEDNGTGEA